MPDLTHPTWWREVKGKVEEREGLLFHKGFPFVPSSEVSFVFEHDGKTRKVHAVLYAEGLEGFQAVQDVLGRYGNIEEDGRPTVSAHTKDIQQELEGTAYFLPAHIWTPWFSLFGSRFGFDDWRDAFRREGLLGIETGLSSDPVMNRLVPMLDEFPILSFSDAHSPQRLGREATLLDVKELSFKGVMEAMQRPLKTYEFYPQEGKYFADGHRKCGQWFYPKESEALSNTCPICKRPLTLGVMHRVYALGKREKAVNVPPFTYVMPLPTLIAKALGVGESSKKVWETYDRLLRYFGGELKVFEAPAREIALAVDGPVRDLLTAFREGRVYWRPGYDGLYGELMLRPPQRTVGLRAFM